LKSGSGPLAGYKVAALLQTSQTPTHFVYIRTFQKNARLGNGKPVYDGHLLKSVRTAEPLSTCAPPVKPNDFLTIDSVGVPVIQVIAEGDYRFGLGGRRPDSDKPDDPYRRYDLPGVAHADRKGYENALPARTDLWNLGLFTQPGRPLPPGIDNSIDFEDPLLPMKDRLCTPVGKVADQPILTYIFHGAFANLETWVRSGTPAPRGEPMQVSNAGTPDAALVYDRFGNALGGIRTTYVDVPAATHHAIHKGPGTCGAWGWTEPFSWERMRSLYGDPQGYYAKVNASVDKAVKERWLSAKDGEKIRSEARSVTAP